VFIGSRCGLLNASNAFGCAWDNVKQARMVFIVGIRTCASRMFHAR
jgi:hypothetical protein